MTARGWWCLAQASVMLFTGVLVGVSLLVVPALTLLLWIGWEWLRFTLRLRVVLRRLRVDREVGDDRGPLTTLWAGRDYDVRVQLRLEGSGKFPFIAVRDPVPFALEYLSGSTANDGLLREGEPIEVIYRITCPRAGLARFEGVRIELSDLQGFFAHSTFLRAVVIYPVMPAVVAARGGGPVVKRHNELPPPGIHRLRQPGSGSELLDLRDYVPGDPPRTIAWKVSARRNRLITKEFESEVPVRATLFIDTSSSVRIPSPVFERRGRERQKNDPPIYLRPLDRLIELAAGVLRFNASLRDLTGVCVFDEHSSRIVRPERSAHHAHRLLGLLGEAASLGPVAWRGDPQVLMPLAIGLAQEVYPDLMRDEVNRMPLWMTWFVGSPENTRHPRGWLDRLHRGKRKLLLNGLIFIPLGLSLLHLFVLLIPDVPEWILGAVGTLWLLGSPLCVFVTVVLFLFSLVVSHRQRRQGRWRKRLAALFTLRSHLSTQQAPPLPLDGGIAALLEDEDLFSLHLHHFLAEHQVPCAVPLYDEQGRYLFALPEKVSVLARALLQAVNRGRDNELFVLMADLLELDLTLEPLLQAVRVALSRHHQVILVCPWPEDVPMPKDKPKRRDDADTLQGLLREMATRRLHVAFARIRQAFARLGVQMICAADDDSVPLILRRLEQLRGARIAAHPGSQR